VGEAFRTLVYLLCFLTSAACAWLLARNYMRTHARLLLWSALCFTFLALNNAVVIVDLLLIQSINLQIPRLILSICAVAILLFGFIWDLEE
jgi:hypothetical protein